ncbi:PAS domain-containing protein [Klebsiella pneumoniae]|nr:PAS domain-containing protein [Klebsiella pneumoniae]
MRNSNKQVIGAMCINLDISDILLAEKTLKI